MMNVSSTQDLYNQIKRYIRTHGRLVFGATVLLCLICYLGWRESAWSEVEQLESPIQSHRESDALGKNKNGKFEDSSETLTHTSEKGEKKYRGKKHEKKRESLEGETDKGKLVFPIRNVVRPYPLLDTFSKELSVVTPTSVLSADRSNMDNMNRKGKGNKYSMEGYAVHPYGNDNGRNTHARHEVGHVKEMQVQLLGIIQGEVPVAVLDINGNTHTVYEGDIVDGVQVHTIRDTKVKVQVNGSVRLIE